MRINIGRSKLLRACGLAAVVTLTGCQGTPTGPGATPAPAGTTVSSVTSVTPNDLALGVALNRNLSVTFNQAMDPTSISSASFTVYQGTTPIAGTVVYADMKATFLPWHNLSPDTRYTITLTTAVKDSAGQALANDVVWSLTTGQAIAAGQTNVALASATPFAILAGSTVTSLGLSVVNGDLGLSAGTATAGFGPGVVNGTIHASDPVALQAKADLVTSFNDAALRSLAPVTLSGNIGGLTLPAGLYKSTSSLAISDGDLTLDAHGDPDAVFIFQIASTLTTTSDRKVILSGGAKASNIYWQIGSSATLGTGSVFKGNLMAYASITLNASASLEGRALTQIGAVSLDASTITVPTP